MLLLQVCFFYLGLQLDTVKIIDKCVIGTPYIDALTGEVMASFYNTEFNKHDGNEGRLMQYAYQFANDSEVECYIEIYDNGQVIMTLFN